MSKENEFEIPLNQTLLVPSRSPLNSIPDPSQYQSKTPEHDTKEKSQSSTRLISTFLKTPGSRIHSRGKSAYLEPFSAQSSTRSGSRLSNVGAASRGFSSAALVRFPGGARFGVLPRVSRGISVAIPQEILVDVPYFELDEDPSFWKDHNVQVLIRIRPLNDVEMASQGYGRCLKQETAQTVVWLGSPEIRFTFDHIACESTSQEKLFRVAGLPMVDNCMSGYNSCMFAYGQTGSGKTYTMMGEVDKMDGKLSDDCGITPRIFEYLFTRIREEEESRKNEQLIYSCKCSFLEIYNEHITDLLEPSSTNLQLREDSKKGVYVENLTEHSVRTVNDVLKLLQQGAANRKIAATYMNSESSRSHSVFTCIIESRWENDSMAHLRFGRLNLVDLAGSERQKSSGAEGDRLKEAANINKSLSTLGLVIRSLVDLAQGKHCHVPYRDSRLTFLLQDSFGGNSKTAIIANVSPSARSANETLSILKFAQSAKLIQNNAKINEDASGDVIVLQQKIQQLKDQLSSLMKNQHASTELVDFSPSHNESTSLSNSLRRCVPSDEFHMYDEHETPAEESLKTRYFRATLRGALKREKLTEKEVRRLKADNERLNRLAHQREEEAQHTKMMLKFREEKIIRLELLSDGLISDEKFYLDENNALREENIRLLEQIRLYQDRERERQTMLAEIPELRNQLLELLEVDKGHAHHQFSQWKGNQELEGSEEFEHCKDMNSKLVREIEELRHQLENGMNCDQDTSISVVNALSRSQDKIIYDKNDKQNVMNFKAEQMADISDLQIDNIHKQLVDAQSLIATMKLEQFKLIKELESVQAENQCLMKMLDSKEISQSKMDNNHEDYDQKLAGCRNQDQTANIEVNENTSISSLQAKLDKLFCDLKEAEILNRQYTEDHTRQISQYHQLELVHDEVELEITKTIIHLQEEIDRLQSEFQVRLFSLAEQNVSLKNNLAVKEDELRMFRAEWEQAILELTTFLIDGSRSLVDASCQVKRISSSFANVHDWVSEHVEKAAKICVEKDETILLLQKSLEDAQKTVMEMEHKLYSLKDATIALTEFQQLDKTTHTEEIQLSRTNDSVELDDFPANKLMPEKIQLTEIQDNVEANYSTSTLGGSVERNVLLPQTNILSLLEKDFLHMHTSMEELLEIAQRDAVEGKRASFSSLRLFLEDLMFKAIQNDISLFVLQRQMAEYFHELRILSTVSNSERSAVQEHCLIIDGLELGHEGRNYDSAFHAVKCESEGDYIRYISRMNTEELCLVHDGTVNKSSELKQQLERKDIILKGLLFDFSLLQELASHRKGIKDELDKLILAMNKVQHELQIRTVQLDDVLVQNTKLEAHLAEAKQALFNSNSELDHAKGELSILSEQNVELKDILKDLYLKNSEAEQLLEEQKETIRTLEKEVIRVSSSAEKQFSSVEDIEDALTLATAERDELVEKLTCLQDRLDMACALADENQSIATEARQESEASKMFAEQKEEEVKILEHSIDELECTINVLEKKVDEMEYEVKKNRVMRDSLKLELQELRHRLLNVEDFTESMTSENSNTSLPDDQLSRKLHSKCVEINEAYGRIRFLEDENSKQSKEIKLLKDYISELVLHAEAQASQYQQQYKNLEQMLHEVKTDISNVDMAPNLERAERTSTRARGSSSPFKCIAGLVQQMNHEKDQELSLAKSRMEELETLSANKHKEVNKRFQPSTVCYEVLQRNIAHAFDQKKKVCILQTRLASTESMTHDVIRDLLSVKLDISNYANIIDQHQLQKLIEDAQHKREEFVAMEREIGSLRNYIDDLLEERERCLSEINEIKENQLATQIILEQLQGRDQLLAAQNDMLKMDKSNLQKRVMELDDMVKKLFKMQETRPNNQSKTNSSLRPFESDLDERLTHSQKMLSRINNQLAQYHQPGGGKLQMHHGTKLRKH